MWYVFSDNLSCPGPARLTENRFAALNRDLIIYPRKTAKIVFNHTSKDRKESWKNDAQQSIFHELGGVRNLV